MSLALIIHGGAKTMSPEELEPHREGVRRAAEIGWAVLKRGGSAVDAVEAAVRAMEDDPVFNAGLGSELNAEGEVQMDAAIMEGAELDAGAVGFIQGVRHPISVARRLLTEKEVLMTGDGARCFAVKHDLEVCAKEALVTPERRKKWEERQGGENNTVGAVALDANGLIAAGASTGGTGGNPRGRVADTGSIGSGVYAENDRGGAAMTGDGEAILRLALAKTAVDRMGEQDPDAVAAQLVDRLERRVQGEGGCALLDARGRVGWHHNSGHMAVAYITETDPTVRAFVQKSEEGAKWPVGR